MEQAPFQNSKAQGLNPQVSDTYLLHRRFDRMGRLVGDQNMEKLFQTHVMVIGLGGVGSWAAESLARSGVGRLTIVDFDEICVTNTNRQLHALQGLVGQKKAMVMAERLQKINPMSKVQAVPEFYNSENSEKIFSLQPDFVLDAIDNLTAKCHLLSESRKRNIPIISSGGASGRFDPQNIQVKDMADSYNDPLLVQVRKILRSQYDFPEKGNFEIPCVFSNEVPEMPIELKYDKGEGFKCVCPQGQNDLHSCDRRRVIYGTASFITGTFGFHMASWVVRQVIKK